MSRTAQPGRVLSVQQLTFIFLGSAAVCAVFFALGFSVGANRRPVITIPQTEQVPPANAIPPPVNSSFPVPNTKAAKAGASPPSRSAAVIEQNLKLSAASSLPTHNVLSPAAATAAKSGTPSSANVRPERHGQRGIMVQVAALRTRQDAQSLLRVLKSHGYAAVVITPEMASAGDHLYRVQVGPLRTHAEALRTLHRLGRQGFRPFIKE